MKEKEEHEQDVVMPGGGGRPTGRIEVLVERHTASVWDEDRAARAL